MLFLVVDDQASMRQLVTKVVEAAVPGAQAIQSADVQGAVEILKGQPVDMVISDWNMPGLTGLDLLRSIRGAPELAHLKDIPVLLLTSAASREHILQAAKAGVTGYVVKPFAPATLIDKIKSIVGAQVPASPAG